MDGTHLYWTTEYCLNSNTADYCIEKVPIVGGTPTTVYESPDSVWGLAVDATSTGQWVRVTLVKAK
jgi:hypothetical protein